MKVFIASLAFALAGCGYQLGPKEVTVWDAKGEKQTAIACGDYMRVTPEGWSSSAFEVTFTDNEGLGHTVYGVKQVVVSDIPKTVAAPMWAFNYPYIPGERYSNKPDGTQGAEIKEGDIVVKGDNQARLVNGAWAPVMVPNTACGKSQ